MAINTITVHLALEIIHIPESFLKYTNSVDKENSGLLDNKENELYGMISAPPSAYSTY